MPLVGNEIPLREHPSMPLVGNETPLREHRGEQPAKTIDIAMLTLPQEQLADVTKPIGRIFDLSRGMVTHRFAVRDLKLRVERSESHCKRDLAVELATLDVDTREAAR